MWPFNRKKKQEVKKQPQVPRARYSIPPPPARVQDDTANHMMNWMIIDSMVNDRHHKHDSPAQDSHSHDHGSSYDSSSHDSGSSYDSGSSDSSSYDSGSSGDF